jgi:DNA-binding helix-hairpin-helix protein with protein kinase domain
MLCTIKGKGHIIDLNNKNFLAQGGEGSVYVIGKTAYKIYNDPKKMLPLGKIRELSVLTDKNIIKPDEVLTVKNQEVGYTMRFVDDTYALCQLFTKAFRQRNNLQHDTMFKLIQSLQNLVKHIHEKKILVVDLNEMNFLASTDFKDIYAIDVDSYQTPTYKATAIMESIRDRHTKNFNEGSDWFSFAILAFQMFIGIHPYKR